MHTQQRHAHIRTPQTSFSSLLTWSLSPSLTHCITSNFPVPSSMVSKVLVAESCTLRIFPTTVIWVNGQTRTTSEHAPATPSLTVRSTLTVVISTLSTLKDSSSVLLLSRKICLMVTALKVCAALDFCIHIICRAPLVDTCRGQRLVSKQSHLLTPTTSTESTDVSTRGTACA